MKSSADFYVFPKWADAPSHAFGGPRSQSLIPPTDKEAYWRIFEEIVAAAEAAIASHPDSHRLSLRGMNYSRVSGSRGHRPVDLWVSICATGAEHLGYMPQVYAIASARGIEIGFAASIPEDDYHNVASKERNRSIVPFINAKLPSPTSALVSRVESVLNSQGGWHYNRMTRLMPAVDGFDQFQSLSSLVSHLKNGGDAKGGGTICRYYPIRQLGRVDVGDELGRIHIHCIQIMEAAMWMKARK